MTSYYMYCSVYLLASQMYFRCGCNYVAPAPVTAAPPAAATTPPTAAATSPAATTPAATTAAATTAAATTVATTVPTTAATTPTVRSKLCLLLIGSNRKVGPSEVNGRI